ncbi:site-specific DNA-methyltransferase [uncultured Mobiluncus sp.]|uniref:DNA-methyltransferase n=1 Tax=uncultured Mobiluncus sp. TaxID=293425 RepID=UPI0025E9F9D0|nr:site-specific DNA-methyltransferase [uncultured Mobiluncus sp.]
MVQEKPPELALTWRGKHEVTLATPRPYVRAERYRETLGGEVATTQSENRLYVGENLQVMSGLLPQYEGSVDCIYIDPPFNSGADYVQQIRTHHQGGPKRTIAVKQYGDRWQTADYLQNLYERLTVLRRFLSPTGTIFVHCDWHSSAALRLVLDEVFGANSLVNEIVWAYASGGGSRRAFGHKHDTILFYARDRRRYFFDPDAVRVAYNATIAPKRRELFNPQGMVAPDVWQISRPPNHSETWVGYPTQKPVEVMQRAIAAACPPGGLVMDCFAGSGSTLVAAAQLGRRFLGIERNSLGVHLARRRLVRDGVGFEVWRDSASWGANRIVPGLESLGREVETRLAKLGAAVATDTAEDDTTDQSDKPDWTELVDWVALDPDFAGFSAGVFTPQSVVAPSRDTVVDFAAFGDSPRGVGLVADVTGQDYFVRLEA